MSDKEDGISALFDIKGDIGYWRMTGCTIIAEKVPLVVRAGGKIGHIEDHDNQFLTPPPASQSDTQMEKI